jgi:broad specificity phosphatase PhoE
MPRRKGRNLADFSIDSHLVSEQVQLPGILRLVYIIKFTNCSIFNTGEAGLDVYNRVSSFIPTLVRDLDRHRRSGIDVDNLNVVIVTHGLSLRLFLSELFQLQIAYHIIFCHAHFVLYSHQSYTELFSEMVPMECILF